MAKDIASLIRATGEARQTQDDLELLSSSSISKDRTVEILKSPRIMADFFRARLSWIFPKELTLKECRPQVLKKRLASRQILSYELVFSDKENRKARPLILIVKRFSNRTAGKREYSNMKIIKHSKTSQVNQTARTVDTAFLKCYWRQH